MRVHPQDQTAPMDRVIREVRTRPPLSPEEEGRLARAVADGRAAAERLLRPGLSEDERRGLGEAVRAGIDAKGALVAANLRLVLAMARRYRWSGLSFLDLFQEGVVGLLRAAERFDWTRGTPFAAYAAWWVRHAMSEAVRHATESVRLPDHLRSSLRRLGQARVDQPEASWEALAERAGVDAEEAEGLVPLLGSPVSLEVRVGPDGAGTLADLLADRDAEEAMDEVLLLTDVERLLRTADQVLGPRERLVLESRYGLGGQEPKTLREVGDQLGVTPQRVAQIEDRALRKIRRALGVGSKEWALETRPPGAHS